VYIANDIVYVQCKHKDNLVYDNLHFHADFKTVLENKKVEIESKDDLSIYMFGFDSLSRLIASLH
jgi:hypothetical protein